MPIKVPISDKYSDCDSASIFSRSNLSSMAGSLSSQFTKKTLKRGISFNIMSVGPPGIGKTTLLSCLFNRNLDVPRKDVPRKDITKIPVEVNTKMFDIEEDGVKLKLLVADCQNFASSLNLHNTYQPIVQYIEQQFAEYHKREFGYNRRELQDTIVHCLFFFISSIGHGLTALDIEFLKAVHEKVNIVPIIAKADALTLRERSAFKKRINEELREHNINIYQIPDADPDDCDEIKRTIKDVQNAVPFAISSMSRVNDKLEMRRYDWGIVELEDRDCGDYLLLKAMLHMNMEDFRERAHNHFYENYRVKMMESTSLRSLALSGIMTSSH